MTEPNPESSQKVYRIGLYGRPSAGKTCMLAALGLPRAPHPKGYSCAHAAIQIPKPDGASKDWDTTDPKAILHLSATELEVAMDQIKRGERPLKTEPGDFHQFHFSLGAEGRTCTLELSDYAGELVDPENQNDPNLLNTRLSQHMAEMDAILVLAEVPRSDKNEKLPDEFGTLEKAFTAIANRRAKTETTQRRAILGLVINKWDRLGFVPNSSYDEAKYEEEVKRLNAGLNGPPFKTANGNDCSLSSHQALANALKNNVGGQQESFASFPVSAFGNPRDAVGELPNKPPLASFGLLDPFVWAVQRTDELDIAEFELAAKNMPRWWPPCLPFTPHRLAEPGRSLSRRFLKDSPQLQRVTAARRIIRGGRLLQSLATILYALIIGLTGEAVWDGVSYRAASSAFKDVHASEQKVERAENWLRSYGYSPFWQHRSFKLYLSRSVALGEAEASRGSRDNAAWTLVADAPDLPAKNPLAEQYLQKFPQGRNALDAKTVIEQAKTKSGRDGHDRWFVMQRTGFQSASLANDDSLLKLLEEIDNGPPQPELTNDDFNSQRSKLRQEVATKTLSLIANKNWEQFLQQYESAWNGDRPTDAGNQLNNWESKEQADWKARATEFRERAAGKLEQKVASLIEAKRWDDAKTSVDDFRVAHRAWTKELQAANTAWLDQLEDKQKVTHDKYLYAQVQTNLDLSSCLRYLDSAPLQSMSHDVLGFQTYLNDTTKKFDYTLTPVSIAWNKDAYKNNSNFGEVELNPGSGPLTTLVKWGQGNFVASIPGKTTNFPTGTGTILGKTIDESMTLKVTLTALGMRFIGWNSHNGGGETTVLLRDAVKSGIAVNLDFNGGRNLAYFTLTGGPVRPDLPAWRAK